MSNNFENIVVVTNLENLSKICSDSGFTKLVTRLTLVGLATGLYFTIRRLDDLEGKYKDLKEDYHNYVIDHSEYNPDLDDDLDI